MWASGEPADDASGGNEYGGYSSDGLTNEEIEEHDGEHPLSPSSKKHSCTDIPWFVLWLLCTAMMTTIRRYAHQNQNLDRLFNGFDIQDRSCGVDPGVKDAPYLFWCGEAFHEEAHDGDYHLNAPMCVESCPNSSAQLRVCDISKNETKELYDYPTRAVAHWCVPRNKTQTTWMINTVLGNGTVAASLKIYRDIHYCWKWVFSISGCLAVIMGGIYLIILNMCASIVLWACKFGLVGCSFWSSWYFLNSAYPMGILGDWLKETGNAETSGWEHQTALVFCFGFFCIGCGFLAWFVCGSQDPRAAIGCIEAASECMMDEKAFFIEPFLATFLKLIILMGNLVGMLDIVSLGEIIPDGNKGIRKRISFNEVQWFCFYYNIFIFIWSQEMVSNISQYSIAWATQVWYFRPKGDKAVERKTCLVFKGYANALRYHMGTIAIGSLLLAFLRPIKHMTEFIAWSLKGADSSITSICACCIHSFEDFLIYVTRSAYMDVALNSEDYDVSSKRAIDILIHEVPEIKTLKRAQLVFQISGTWMITYSCAYLTLLYVAYKKENTDPDRESYIEDSTGVSVLAGVQAFFISTCFMNVFDTVGETILYCYASELRRRKDREKQRKQDNLEEGYTAEGAVNSMWGYLFGDETDEEDGHQTHASDKLQKVLAETRKDIQEDR